MREEDKGLQGEDGESETRRPRHCSCSPSFVRDGAQDLSVLGICC